MENNPTVPLSQPVAPQTIGPLSQMTQAPQPKMNVGRTIMLFVSAVLIVIVLMATGYMFFLGNTNKVIHKAQVYSQPTVAPTATPTPSAYQVNPKDSSDNAINQDTQATDQSLNNLDTDLNNVDQSFNDQQTNLQ